jgi:1,4-dihydroxy-2-naphthoyl-CoA hydrolase
MERAAAPPHVTGFDRLYGLEVTERSETLARGIVSVREELKQPPGIVHGGVYAAIAEGLAVSATALAVAGKNRLATGLSCQTSLLHPVGEGVIHAVAHRRHGGRTTWVWEVEMTDGSGRLCALARMTIAVNELPAQASS